MPQIHTIRKCLVDSWCNKQFRPEFVSTIGVEFAAKNIWIDNKHIKVHIWDTAGQERFRTLTTNFYRRADGIIVSFDVTDKKTFDAVSTWMKAISEHADASADVVLCGNKIDLVNER